MKTKNIKAKLFVLLSAFLFSGAVVSAQKINKNINGISISYFASRSGFQLTESMGEESEKKLYRGGDVFFPKYGIDYAHRKRDHFVSRFGIGFMPSFTRYYNSTKMKDDDEWIDYDNTKYRVELTAIDLHLINTWRINLYEHNYHILLGFGFGAGLVDMKFNEADNDKKQFIQGFGFPLAGLDIDIGNWITFFTQYQYLFGATTTQLSKGDQSFEYSYIMKGPEINFGVNIYF